MPPSSSALIAGGREITDLLAVSSSSATDCASPLSSALGALRVLRVRLRESPGRIRSRKLSGAVSRCCLFEARVVDCVVAVLTALASRIIIPYIDKWAHTVERTLKPTFSVSCRLSDIYCGKINNRKSRLQQRVPRCMLKTIISTLGWREYILPSDASFSLLTERRFGFYCIIAAAKCNLCARVDPLPALKRKTERVYLPRQTALSRHTSPQRHRQSVLLCAPRLSNSILEACVCSIECDRERRKIELFSANLRVPPGRNDIRKRAVFSDCLKDHGSHCCAPQGLRWSSAELHEAPPWWRPDGRIQDARQQWVPAILYFSFFFFFCLASQDLNKVFTTTTLALPRNTSAKVKLFHRIYILAGTV